MIWKLAGDVGGTKEYWAILTDSPIHLEISNFYKMNYAYNSIFGMLICGYDVSERFQ